MCSIAKTTHLVRQNVTLPVSYNFLSNKTGFILGSDSPSSRIECVALGMLPFIYKKKASGEKDDCFSGQKIYMLITRYLTLQYIDNN